MLGFSPWYMFHGNLQHHRKLSNKPLKLNSGKYKMRASRIWTDLIRIDSILTGNASIQLIILGFSPWYMLHGNLQHHHKLSKKYKMRAPISLNWFNKYRFDITWRLCKAFGYFHNASTSIHLGTLRHQLDVGDATYIPITTSSVDL